MEKKKILIADPDSQISKQIKAHKSAHQYTIETAADGFGCISKIDTFKPDLILLELMLPHIHGIEILRKIKNNPRTHQVGVILSSGHTLVQNYQIALSLGAVYFIEKPFKVSEIFSLLNKFFNNKLQPGYRLNKEISAKANHCYVPKVHSPNSYIKFWGTRGSSPVAGAEYVRFGGNTSCLEIRHEETWIIVDAGTGIRPLGTLMQAHKPKHIYLLISHTHWDHLAGFSFFAPVYDPECTITVMTPIGFERSTRELFTEMLAHCYFPVRLEDVQARVIFKDIHEGVPFTLGSIDVNTHYAYHPGATLCFTFSIDKTTFGYATDNEFLMGYHGNPRLIKKTDSLLKPYLSMIQFFKKCDFLIHEAQYTPQEYLKKVGWGHSSVTNAASLIVHAGIRQWIITHHDPQHTDEELLQKIQMQHDIFDALNYPCRSSVAFDGLIIPL